MIDEAHPFKCGNCKKVTAHREVKHYDTKDVDGLADEIWLMECQNCYEQRMIDPVERVATKEDDIMRCLQCGNYKMKAANCRICRIANEQEQIKVKYWTGNTTLERALNADI